MRATFIGRAFVLCISVPVTYNRSRMLYLSITISVDCVLSLCLVCVRGAVCQCTSQYSMYA